MKPVSVAALVAATLGLSGCGLAQTGLFARTTPVGGPCETLTGFAGGTEDLAVDYAARQIFVSADDRRGDGPGAIHVLRFEDLRPGGPVRDATGGRLRNFHPHGIGLWKGTGGSRRLFVVNHPHGAASRVDIFDVAEDGSLTLSGDGGSFARLDRPNDVAPVGQRAFYATNDHGGSGRTTDGGGPLDLVESIFALNLATVVHVDDRGGSREAARGLSFANGLALSPDMSRLHVAETVDGRVRTYRRGPDGSLTPERSIRVGPNPDNLTVEPDGRIWVGAHNNGLAITLRRADASRPSPGRVVTIEPAEMESQTVLQTLGLDLSALSVAARIGTQVVAGSIDEPKLLLCDLDHPSDRGGRPGE